MGTGPASETEAVLDVVTPGILIELGGYANSVHARLGGWSGNVPGVAVRISGCRLAGFPHHRVPLLPFLEDSPFLAQAHR